MTARPTAFVLGMTCNGLSVARSLGRQGVRVIAVDSYHDRSGLKTRYAERVEYAPSNIIENESPWLDFLLELAAGESIKPVLFPTEDAYVLFVSRHREALGDFFEFNLAPDDIVHAAVSKLGTYQLAVRCGIPTPWTYLVRTMEDYEQIAEKVSFPCALKPSLAHVWLKRYKADKLLVITQPEQLRRRLRELMHLEIEVVLQEIIPGGDAQVYVFEACVGRSGDVLGYAGMHKLRQWPVDFGVGAFNIGVVEPRLTETALSMLRNSGYRGIASTEYMLDPRDGQYKLIDINPRTCMIGELAVASGVDIPYLYYLDVTGERVEPHFMDRPGLKWQNFEWDTKSFLVHRRRGDLSLRGWLKSLRGTRVYAYYARDDVVPFLHASIGFVRRLLVSLMGQVFSKSTTPSARG